MTPGSPASCAGPVTTGGAIGGFINGQDPGVRPTMETTLWFNRVLNVIHRHAPEAQLILVRDPAGALPAIRRVLG